MAVLECGILGPFSGKVGNVIGYERNGVFCMRSMPTHYRDRRSAAQLKNRNRFAMVMKVMSAVRPATALGFRHFATAMTEMNVATRVNYYSLVHECGTGLEYAFGGLVLSRGPVEKLEGVTMMRVGTGFELVWNGNSIGSRGGEEDLVSVVMVEENRLRAKMLRGVGKRGDEMMTVALPSGWNGAETHCYVMVERDGEWSESEYVGTMNGTESERLGAMNGADAVILGDFVGGEADGVSITSEEKFIEDSDQSAIKVLSDLGKIRSRKGAETPPGEEK